MRIKNENYKILNDDYMTMLDLKKEFGIKIEEQRKMMMKKRQENDINPLPFIRVAGRIFYK